MLKFVKGNILDSEAHALVNPVNCEGYMGKGVAYQFKLRYPQMNKQYVEVCKNKLLFPGRLHHYDTGDKLIINFPTKVEWRKKSEIEYITAGLDALVSMIKDKNIKSIAIPPLGCGNGGLSWDKVKPIIENKLGEVSDSVDVYIYTPI